MLPEIHKVLGLLEGGFAELKVLVVGDLMLDRYILGEVDRISPEAPVPVLRHAQRYERPGGAANVAMNLAGLGCQAFLAGFWGNDGEQRELAAFLDKAKIDTAGIVTTQLPTISKDAHCGTAAAAAALGYRKPRRSRAKRIDQRLIERTEVLATKVHAVVLSDYAKGALTNGAVRARDPRGSALRACWCWRTRRRRTSASTLARRWCARTCTS